MNPPLQGNTSFLLSQLLHSASKCTSRSLVVLYLFPFLFFWEHRLIEVLRHVLTIVICHRHIVPTTLLNRQQPCAGPHQQSFPRTIQPCDKLTGSRIRQREAEIARRQEDETHVAMKLKPCLQRFLGFQRAVAYKVEKSVFQKVV